MLVCREVQAAAGPNDIGVTQDGHSHHSRAGHVGGSEWAMAARYVLARLRGGPLNGDVVEAPVDSYGLPAKVIGLPVPVLDERKAGRFR